jgi:DNA-binding MarR family transcriptional regulator
MDSDAVIRLRRVVLKLARQLNAASREEGLTPTQASVLGITTVRGPLSLAELTELEGINPTMLSRVIGKLDEYGLLKRLRDPDDFRAARVEVTPKGRGVYERITVQRSGNLRIRVRPARRSAGRAVRGVAGAGKPGRGPAGHGAARPGPAPGLAAARLTRSAG